MAAKRLVHSHPSERPEPGEYAAYAQADIDGVEGDDAIEVLIRQGKQTVALFQELGEPHGNLTYTPGKWTVKQVLGHLADDERIFAFAALLSTSPATNSTICAFFANDTCRLRRGERRARDNHKPEPRRVAATHALSVQVAVNGAEEEDGTRRGVISPQSCGEHRKIALNLLRLRQNSRSCGEKIYPAVDIERLRQTQKSAATWRRVAVEKRILRQSNLIRRGRLHVAVNLALLRQINEICGFFSFSAAMCSHVAANKQTCGRDEQVAADKSGMR